jgi:hypothetical protein
MAKCQVSVAGRCRHLSNTSPPGSSLHDDQEMSFIDIVEDGSHFNDGMRLCAVPVLQSGILMQRFLCSTSVLCHSLYST